MPGTSDRIAANTARARLIMSTSLIALLWRWNGRSKEPATSGHLQLRQVIDIDQTCRPERFTHVVHVETERAGGELLAFADFVGEPFFASCGHVGRFRLGNHHHSV